jgi:hypothetical protein
VPKISAKFLAERCAAVFTEQIAGKAKIIWKGIPAGIFEELSAALTARYLRKPIGDQLPSAYTYIPPMD